MANIFPESFTMILAGVTAILLAICLYLAYFYIEQKKKYPESVIIAESDKKKIPIIEVIDSTNTRHTFLAKKKDKMDYKFKSDFGLQVDPNNLTVVESERYPRGQPVYRYVPDFYAPVGVKGSRAILELRNHIRKEHPELDFIIDDLTLINLVLVDSSDKLAHDCRIILEQYEQSYDEDGFEEITESVLVETIESIKDEIPSIQLKPGFINFRNAVKLLPIGVTALDIKTIEQKVTAINNQSKIDDFKKYCMWAFLAFSPIVAFMIFYLVWSSLQ